MRRHRDVRHADELVKLEVSHVLRVPAVTKGREKLEHAPEHVDHSLQWAGEDTTGSEGGRSCHNNSHCHDAHALSPVGLARTWVIQGCRGCRGGLGCAPHLVQSTAVHDAQCEPAAQHSHRGGGNRNQQLQRWQAGAWRTRRNGDCTRLAGLVSDVWIMSLSRPPLFSMPYMDRTTCIENITITRDKRRLPVAVAQMPAKRGLTHGVTGLQGYTLTLCTHGSDQLTAGPGTELRDIRRIECG